MKNNQNISNNVIKRLPRYYRYFGDLKALGVTRISSKDLSKKMGVTASQIRQDFNCFGGFGQQGYGYNVDMLYEQIGKILGNDRKFKTIIIGAGNLGKTIAHHREFEQAGFVLIGIFDTKPSIIGQMINGIPVRHLDNLDEFCRENFPEVASLCVPPDSAKNLVPILVKLGIKSFWNFSQYDISVDYPDVAVENIHLGDSLLTLCYKTNNLDNQNIQKENR